MAALPTLPPDEDDIVVPPRRVVTPTVSPVPSPSECGAKRGRLRRTDSVLPPRLTAMTARVRRAGLPPRPAPRRRIPMEAKAAAYVRRCMDAEAAEAGDDSFDDNDSAESEGSDDSDSDSSSSESDGSTGSDGSTSDSDTSASTGGSSHTSESDTSSGSDAGTTGSEAGDDSDDAGIFTQITQEAAGCKR